MNSTKLTEIENQLPNGFHDAYIEAIALDMMANTATLDLELWVGDLYAPPGPEREAYQRGRLRLNGLAYFVIEPPGPNADWFMERELGPTPRISGADEARPDAESEYTRPPVEVPDDAFAHYFFVFDWNTFIHVAARSADFEWTEEHAHAVED